jgi:hypothetical protein
LAGPFLFGGAFLICASTLWPQQMLTGSGPGGMVRIFNTDMAVLEMQDARKDLPCTVTPIKPVLGFDLRFHSGYDVAVPMNDLSGSENLLTILFRVIPEHHPEDPIYFVHRVRVPEISEDAKGDAVLQGGFDLGEGKYHVDWLMRDRSERVCSFYWDSEATLTAKDRQMNLVMAPEAVAQIEGNQFKEEPPVERAQAEPRLKIKVLMNFAPQNALSPAMQPIDTSALVSILRSIFREPRIDKFSLVAFNMQEQRVVYRQENADKIDFPALGEAIGGLKLGTVKVSQLAVKHSDTQFLAELIRKEVATEEDHPDAIIFAGPKVMLDANVQQETLKDLGEVDYPIFYMNYNLFPQSVPWRDSISHAVKYFKGQEYTITRPRDLWFAMSEMVGRIVKAKLSHRTAAGSNQ